MISNIRIYGNPQYRNFSWVEINRTTKNGQEFFSTPHNPGAVVPGRLQDDVYIRTDLSELPEEIRALAIAYWSDSSYRLHEQFLRNQ